MIDFQKDCGLEIIRDLVKDDPNLSRIYGLILYTKAQPYVIKVLRDVDYWNEFDYVSGRNWPIFTMRPLQQDVINNNSNGPEDNLLILSDFGLEDSNELPLFMVFMWDDENKLNSITVKIRGKNVEEVHDSLRSIIETISNVEKKVLPEYKGSVNVFRNVKTELDSQNNITKVIELSPTIIKLAEFLNTYCSN